MAICPYCTNNSISSLKANMSRCGKPLVCSSCHKEVIVPAWPKIVLLIIVSSYFLIRDWFGLESSFLILSFSISVYFTITSFFLIMSKS